MTAYRIGNHQPRNLYRGDEYIGVMFDPADAALIVDALEGHTPDGHFEAIGLLGLVRTLRRDGEDGILTWAKFDEACDDFMRRRQSEDAPSARAISPETAQNASGVAECTPDALSGSEGRMRPVVGMTETALRVAARTVTAIRPGIEPNIALAAIHALLAMGWTPPATRRCICNDPPPTVIGRDGKKNGTAVRPDDWACPRHGEVI